jgi:hypothetical protein
MQIEDILQEREFKALDEYLTRLMDKTAGEELVKMMVITHGNFTKARDWYFSNNTSLGGKRPYDLCAEQNYGKVEYILGLIKNDSI